MNLNRVILIGRLAADPESRTTNTGQSVASVRMVTNRTWKDQSGQKQEQAEFHSITLWGRLADIASQYLKKGALAMIEGRLQTRSYTDKNNVKQYRTEVVAENLQLGPRAASSMGGGRPGAERPAPDVEPALGNAGTDGIKNLGKNIGIGTTEQFRDRDADIPVINADEPISDPIIESNEIEEKEVDLKDIPF